MHKKAGTSLVALEAILLLKSLFLATKEKKSLRFVRHSH